MIDHPPLGLLEMSAYRRIIVQCSLGTLFFAAVNGLAGAGNVGNDFFLGGEAMVALAAVQAISGLIGLFVFHPITLILEGTTLLLLASWHAYLTVLVATHPDEYMMQGNNGLIFQVAGAFVAWSKAFRYARLRRDHGPLSSEDYRLCKAFIRRLRKETPDGRTHLRCRSTTFWSGIWGVQYRILLSDRASFVKIDSWLDYLGRALFIRPVFIFSKESVRAYKERWAIFGRKIVIPPSVEGESAIRIRTSDSHLARLWEWANDPPLDPRAIAAMRSVAFGFYGARRALGYSFFGFIPLVPPIALILALIAQSRIRRYSPRRSWAARWAVALSLVWISFWTGLLVLPLVVPLFIKLPA